ncbi:hypothetical protein Vadar_004260 [Vaccinium darrowii]|uniref:Uncharacterized protein n=2 Tax=Vaccinium darrowii TaxID=229202 RepID=A0ACB7ZIE0_9ERIC|nr:hypothetical protein Vadar_010860 [Vaccinium darrowii]KAH7865256.1 hypothetical protein Vadar_004260 [Vaccinium darrowii]
MDCKILFLDRLCFPPQVSSFRHYWTDGNAKAWLKAYDALKDHTNVGLFECYGLGIKSAFDKHNVEKDVAEAIKQELYRKHGPIWHCIVMKNFDSIGEVYDDRSPSTSNPDSPNNGSDSKTRHDVKYWTRKPHPLKTKQDWQERLKTIGKNDL